MTLVEVVTGVVILGTVLASLAVARGRFARQWSEADQKLAATRALDALINEWMSGGGTPAPRVPLQAEGPLAGLRDCVWRTQTVRDASAAQLNAVIVRVEAISRPSRLAQPALLASVDLLVHFVPPRPTSRPAARGAP